MKIYNFFQEETEAARRSQVKWSMKVGGFSKRLFENLLGISKSEFRNWLSGKSNLSKDQLQILDLFWDMMIRFISFCSDEERLRIWIESIPKNGSTDPRVISPFPWIEMKLEDYLIREKLDGIGAVITFMWWMKSGDCEQSKLRHSKNPELLYKLAADASRLDEKDRWLLICWLARALLENDSERDAVLLDEGDRAYCYIIPTRLRSDLVNHPRNP